MKLTHRTQAELELNKKGLWGDFIFFTCENSHYGKISYELDIDDDEILSCEDIAYSDLVDNEVNKLAECIKFQTGIELDFDTVQNLLSEQLSVYGVEEIADFYINDCSLYADFTIEQQKLTAKAAKKMGYNVVKINDEFGKSYMVDINVYFSKIKRIS